MKKLIPYLVLTSAVMVLVASASLPVAGQTPGKLAVFSDMALFAGPKMPRNCFTMNRFKVGEPVGFRISVLDPAGQPAADAEVVVHLTYAGKTVDVPARYRGAGGNNPIPNLWSAKWAVPADAPVGTVGVTITAKDKSGRTGEFKPFPNPAGQLTIVTE